jgi:PHS family inorganic phosphate transporter-like MFS transporter
MGFFTDAYDLFCISLVTKPDLGTLLPNIVTAVNGVALCGTLAGQLFFGWLDDRLGQKSVYGMTLLLRVVCSLTSMLSFGSTSASFRATLCFFRFWLGFGIGGDYLVLGTTPQLLCQMMNMRPMRQVQRREDQSGPRPRMLNVWAEMGE